MEIKGSDVSLMNFNQRPSRFSWLYERHFRLVWTVVGQLGLAGAAREDAVQEIWLTIYRRLDTLDPEASSRAWVCSIARKVVWRLRRNAQRRDRRVLAYASEPVSSQTCAARRVEVTGEVEAALAALSEEQRAVLVMANVHGLTAPEISTSLGLPVNTVYSRLRLARRRLESISVDERDVHTALESTDRPPTRLRSVVWAALQPSLAKPAVAAAAGSWGTVKAVALGMALGGAGVAALVLPEKTPVADAEEVAVRSQRKATLRGEAPRASAPAPERHPDVVVPEPVEGSDNAPLRVVAKAPKLAKQPRVENADAASTNVPVVPSVPPSESPRELAAPDLAAEAKLLRDAQNKLKAGDASEALALLASHEKTYGDGALADVRDGAMVRALCRLGRTEQAARVAGRLKSTSPGSPVATAVAGQDASPCSAKKNGAGDGSDPAGR